jgi:Flp pilus assembly protein TadB
MSTLLLIGILTRNRLKKAQSLEELVHSRSSGNKNAGRKARRDEHVKSILHLSMLDTKQQQRQIADAANVKNFFGLKPFLSFCLQTNFSLFGALLALLACGIFNRFAQIGRGELTNTYRSKNTVVTKVLVFY